MIIERARNGIAKLVVLDNAGNGKRNKIKMKQTSKEKRRQQLEKVSTKDINKIDIKLF
jgi:hypothetical protein